MNTEQHDIDHSYCWVPIHKECRSILAKRFGGAIGYNSHVNHFDLPILQELSHKPVAVQDIRSLYLTRDNFESPRRLGVTLFIIPTYAKFTLWLPDPNRYEAIRGKYCSVIAFGDYTWARFSLSQGCLLELTVIEC